MPNPIYSFLYFSIYDENLNDVLSVTNKFYMSRPEENMEGKIFHAAVSTE